MDKHPVLHRGTPVFIEWSDSASYGGWRADTFGMETGQVRSIGYVFGVTDEGIILATSLASAPPTNNLVALDPVVIPIGAIKRMQVLAVAPEQSLAKIQLEGVLVEE